MCSEYPKIDQRKQKGAEIYVATIPEGEDETSSVDESMLNDESTKTSDKEEEYYHCYTSCVNYNSSNPEACRQLQKEKKTGSQCPIKKILDEHRCGDQDKMPEALFKRMNKERTLKWVRAGLEGDMVKYREARDYTQEDVIQAHYIEVIEKPSKTEVSNGEMTADISDDFGGWRTEDESRFYKCNEEDSEYETENSEAEEEEYEQEDYYKEVKIFSELTEEEIDIVAEKLRNISQKI
jgi:hypothetical protein